MAGSKRAISVDAVLSPHASKKGNRRPTDKRTPQRDEQASGSAEKMKVRVAKPGEAVECIVCERSSKDQAFVMQR